MHIFLGLALVEYKVQVYIETKCEIVHFLFSAQNVQKESPGIFPSKEVLKLVHF